MWKCNENCFNCFLKHLPICSETEKNLFQGIKDVSMEKVRKMVCSNFSFKTFENVPWGQSVHIENIVKQYLDTMFHCLPTASRSAKTFQLIETP